MPARPRRSAEAQGRLDFTAEVESAGTGGPPDLTARIRVGIRSCGRAHQVHRPLRDQRLHASPRHDDLQGQWLDVGQLRRSLAQGINDIGVFEPLALADISVARRDDGVTADLTIPLRERKRRWWSVSGPVFPVIGTWRATLSSRLPPWGRSVFEAATYFVSLNLVGFAKPFLALQRPVIPGQELLSGFAVSPALSPRAMLIHYGGTHAAHGIGTMLDGERIDPLAVPVTSAGPLEAEPLICVPPKPRLWWLRRGAAAPANVALAALIP